MLFPIANRDTLNLPTDPGSSAGANRLWFNTTTRAFLVRNAANTGWEVLAGTGPGINYVPATYNFNVGAGENIARYTRVFGRHVVGNGMCTFVNPGATTNANPFGIELPWPAVDTSVEIGMQFYFHGAGRGFDLPAGGAYGAVGLVSSGTVSAIPDRKRISLFATAGSPAWNNLTPFTWNGGEGDGFTYFYQYETEDAEDINYVETGKTFVSCGVWT